MATSMYTFVTVKNGNKEVAERLRELLDTSDSNDLVNRLYGTDYCEGNYPTIEWMEDNVGSKWIVPEFHYNDYPEMCHIQFETAYSVPQQYLQKLAVELSKVKEDCYIVGDYEDETQDMNGAFVYARDYEDIEDTDSFEIDEIIEKLQSDGPIEDIGYTGTTIEFEDGWDWFVNSPNGREKLHDLQAELRVSLEEAYLEYLEDMKLDE